MGEEQAGDGRRQGGVAGKVVALAVAAAAVLLIPLIRLTSGQGWGSNPMLATYILSGSILAGEAAVIILLRTARTRYTVERQIRQNRDVHEYVILWNRPRWVLYTPAMLTAVLFGVLLKLRDWGLFPQAATPELLGGIWVAICFVVVLVEQYHMSIKVVLIAVPSVGVVLLALHLVGYADEAVGKLYFMAAFVIGFVLFLGWLHGLFHYVAITPNVADLQRGLTETGRQVKNEDYDVEFDATDVVERWLFGFAAGLLRAPRLEGGREDTPRAERHGHRPPA